MKHEDQKQPYKEIEPGDISIDALVDDLVGLNWRAVKTLIASFTQPDQLCKAAWSANWDNRFTPSFRLWFTLVAVLFFFQFFWASKDGALIAMFANQIQNRNAILPDSVSFNQAATTFARINFAIVPFASAIALFCLGIVYRAWGRTVPLVVRVRYVFLVVLPSTALSIALFMLAGIAPVSQISLILMLTWLVPIPIDAWIAWRSVFREHSTLERVWRAIALSVAILAVTLVAGFASTQLAAIWIAFRYG